MRWRDKRRSSNIEDRRGQRRSRGRKGLGGGFTLLIILGLFLLFGKNPLQLIGLGGNENTIPYGQTPTRSGNTPAGGRTTAVDENKEFVSVILASTEDAWGQVFRKAGYQYETPKLVLFDDYVNSACGMTSAATGPFYCPGDHKVYIDLGFFRELSNMGAKGDFARAYVIAHEIGHHIQNLQGISMKIQDMQRRVNKRKANQLSVLTELQADCYAGIWIHNYEKQADIMERGDIEEGIRAAASIGDDRMQRNAGQRVNPDAFTHGSSADRTQWFKIGMKYGDMRRCDTFKESGL
jgi:predicted metalloprotease